VDVESVRTIGLRQVVGVLERALDPSVSLEVLEEAMRRLTELDAAGRVPGAPAAAVASAAAAVPTAAVSTAAVSAAAVSTAAAAPAAAVASAVPEKEKREAVSPVEDTA